VVTHLLHVEHIGQGKFAGQDRRSTTVPRNQLGDRNVIQTVKTPQSLFHLGKKRRRNRLKCKYYCTDQTCEAATRYSTSLVLRIPRVVGDKVGDICHVSDRDHKTDLFKQYGE